MKTKKTPLTLRTSMDMFSKNGLSAEALKNYCYRTWPWYQTNAQELIFIPVNFYIIQETQGPSGNGKWMAKLLPNHLKHFQPSLPKMATHGRHERCERFEGNLCPT